MRRSPGCIGCGPERLFDGQRPAAVGRPGESTFASAAALGRTQSPCRADRREPGPSCGWAGAHAHLALETNAAFPRASRRSGCGFLALLACPAALIGQMAEVFGHDDSRPASRGRPADRGAVISNAPALHKADIPGFALLVRLAASLAGCRGCRDATEAGDGAFRTAGQNQQAEGTATSSDRRRQYGPWKPFPPGVIRILQEVYRGLGPSATRAANSSPTDVLPARQRKFVRESAAAATSRVFRCYINLIGFAFRHAAGHGSRQVGAASGNVQRFWGRLRDYSNVCRAAWGQLARCSERSSSRASAEA